MQASASQSCVVAKQYIAPGGAPHLDVVLPAQVQQRCCSRCVQQVEGQADTGNGHTSTHLCQAAQRECVSSVHTNMSG